MHATLKIADRDEAAMWAGLLLSAAVKDASHQTLDDVIKTTETIQ